MPQRVWVERQLTNYIKYCSRAAPQTVRYCTGNTKVWNGKLIYKMFDDVPKKQNQLINYHNNYDMTFFNNH